MQLYEIILIASPIIAVGLSLSLMIGIAFYMASKILNDSSMYKRGKDFFMSSLETIIIVIGFGVITSFLDMAFFSLMGCSTSCIPITFAEISMNRLSDLVIHLYMVFYLFDLFVGPFIQSSVSTGFGALGLTTTQLSFMPLIGLDIIMEFFYMVMQRIVDLLIFIIARQGILQVSIPLVAYLFPTAVILRSIPPTRRVGSSLFAIVIVLYYVFPLSVLFSDYMIFHLYKTDLVQQKNYNIDVSEKSDYVFKGDVGGGKDRNVIDNQLTVQEERVEQAIEATPIGRSGGDSLTVEEALSNIAGSALSQFSSRGKLLTFTTISSAVAAFLSNTPKYGWTGVLAKVGSFLFYTSYLQGLLMTISPFKWMADLFNAFVVLSSQVAQIAVVTFITLIFEIVISITSYRAVANILKGDVTMLGLTKVI